MLLLVPTHATLEATLNHRHRRALVQPHSVSVISEASEPTHATLAVCSVEGDTCVNGVSMADGAGLQKAVRLRSPGQEG